jgi:hypothetical protein
VFRTRNFDPEGMRLPIKLGSTSHGEFPSMPSFRTNRWATRLARERATEMPNALDGAFYPGTDCSTGLAIAFLFGLGCLVAAFLIPLQEAGRWRRRARTRICREPEDKRERCAARGYMMRYQVMTVQTPQEVMERAMRHFGPQGAGLHVTSQNLLGVVFQGGGGYVAVTLQPGAEETVVE